jgi:hypothetical protein
MYFPLDPQVYDPRVNLSVLYKISDPWLLTRRVDPRVEHSDPRVRHPGQQSRVTNWPVTRDPREYSGSFTKLSYNIYSQIAVLKSQLILDTWLRLLKFFTSESSYWGKWSSVQPKCWCDVKLSSSRWMFPSSHSLEWMRTSNKIPWNHLIVRVGIVQKKKEQTAVGFRLLQADWYNSPKPPRLARF